MAKPLREMRASARCKVELLRESRASAQPKVELLRESRASARCTVVNNAEKVHPATAAWSLLVTFEKVVSRCSRLVTFEKVSKPLQSEGPFYNDV